MPWEKWGHEVCREKVCFVCLNEKVKHKSDVKKLRPSDIELIRKHLLPYDKDDSRWHFRYCYFVINPNPQASEWSLSCLPHEPAERKGLPVSLIYPTESRSQEDNQKLGGVQLSDLLEGQALWTWVVTLQVANCHNYQYIECWEYSSSSCSCFYVTFFSEKIFWKLQKKMRRAVIFLVR